MMGFFMDPLEGADSAEVQTRGILSSAELVAAESANFLKAVDQHLKRRKSLARAWLTEAYLRKVHKDMFGDVWDWAGRYRKAELKSGVLSEKVREQIALLCDDVLSWDGDDGGLLVIDRAVRIHHRLSWVRAFQDGNGRHARLVADIYLHSYNYPLPNWSLSNLSRGAAHETYLKALKEADKGNFNPLLGFTLQHMVQ